MIEVSNNNSIIFVTAYKDLGRENWKGFERSREDYINYFKKLYRNHIRLICFCEEEISDILNKELGFKNCYPYDSEHTYYRYLEKEKEIMNSNDFKNIVSHRKEHPECCIPEYNIVNHNKVIFLQRAKNMFPEYTHYSWIDFGCIRNDDNIFVNFDWTELKPQIHYSAFYKPNVDDIKCPKDICVDAPTILQGSIFIVPNNLVDWYVDTYTSTLEWFHQLNLVDDDQGVIIQIYKKHSDKFILHTTNEWFKLLHSFSKKSYFDVVIPTCEKDIETVNICIEKVKKHVIDVRNVYVICNSSLFGKINNAICIDEDIFPFNKNDIHEYEICRERKGWFFQQLLKLYAYKIISNLSNNFLIVDSETIYYNNFNFIGPMKKSRYFISNEVNTSYRTHIQSVLPEIKLFDPNISGITHTMLFQQNILNELFDRIKINHKRITGQELPCWRILLLNVQKVFSEYDIYFNFVMDYHKYHCGIVNEYWDTVSYIPEKSNCLFLTAHRHERSINIPRFRFRVKNN
jgi:hypothetical protein